MDTGYRRWKTSSDEDDELIQVLSDILLEKRK
jgi:hypothetical protein